MIQRKTVFLALVASFTLPVAAQTYKCKDKQGLWTEEACPDYEQRQIQKGRKLLEEKNKREWTPRIGMQASEVEKILKSPECRKTKAYKWCGYWTVNTAKTSHGSREQWVFKDARGMPLWYLYFDNGILVTIQE